MAKHRMLILDRDRGLLELDLASQEARSLIGKHHSAIGRYLETGDDERLRDLRGKTLRTRGETYELETDPETIEQFALAGDLGYDDVYVLE